MALEEYWRAIKKWWWLLIASTIVASVSSYISVSRAPKIYQATTTVIVGQSLSKSDPTYQDFSIGQQLAQTYVNMVRRRPTLQGAAEALGLSYVPAAENISAQMVPGTQLVEISVRDTSPQRARALADGIAQQLIQATPGDPAEEQVQRAFAQEQLRNLESNIEATELEIEEEQARLDASNSARAIQQYQSNVEALQQKITSYQSNYASLLQTVQGGANYISVIEPAITPTVPSSPKVMETVALAACIGLALATGGALLIEFLDDTVKVPEDLERATGLPTLGSITEISGKVNADELITMRNPLSPVAEAFRALRTNVEYYGVDHPIRSLAITSAGPTEGKSVVLANLAVVLAQSGRSVILVDADLRRPRQHNIFHLDNSRGLSDAIFDGAQDLSSYGHKLDAELVAGLSSDDRPERFDEYVREVGLGRLEVVTAGSSPPNPADLLGSARMAQLVEGLYEKSDIVLFDTPPVLAVTDAVVLSRLTDGVLLLAESGRTKSAPLRQAVERLRQVDANLLGTILNRVSGRGDGYYSYQDYHRRDQDEQDAKYGLKKKL